MKMKEVRQKLGMTQAEFAPLMGMTQQAITKIERGYEGRKETNVHLSLLTAIDLIYRHGLIDEVIIKLNKVTK
jgi:DNA-binding XRE family transcriptional regulator